MNATEHGLSLYKILRRVLGELNEQVVEHGDRVAYLYRKLAEYRNQPDDDWLEKMMLICYAHDIGAYKTEKFLDLLRFDVTHTLEHCIYSYIFMKYFSPLKEAAEVLLYHHTFYSERDNYKSPYINDGILVHFLDRVDILNIKYGNDEDVLKQVKNVADLNFAPIDVADFEGANKKYGILAALRDGSYQAEVQAYFDSPERINRLAEPIIRMLTYEIDFKSEQTVIHTITTTLFAGLLAQRLGLDADRIAITEYAAKLHDLGKIKIPSEIIEKPGRLTKDEYEIMKKHAGYTYEFVSELFPERIARIAGRHHERLDGSGYPKGLRGDELTTEDRIVEVADVVSALTQKRSYKDVMDKDTVLRILNEEADLGRLDAEIVGILNRDYDDIFDRVMQSAAPTINRFESLQSEYSQYLEKYADKEVMSDEFGLFTGIIG